MDKVLFTKEFFRRRALGIQFWAYEGGNAIAAIAGAGGLSALRADWAMASNAVAANEGHGIAAIALTLWSIALDHPDLTVVFGIVAVAFCGPVLRSGVIAFLGEQQGRVPAMLLDIALLVLGLLILSLALAQDASHLTQAAAAFVVGSALLRQAERQPVFLKLGGLALAMGGVCLGLHGLEQMSQGDTVLGTLMTGTGIYVALASLLTYEGGVFACRAIRDTETPTSGPWDHLWNARQGVVSMLLQAFMDRPILRVNALARATLLRPIPRAIRFEKPFLTSMWARLPWRLATAALAAFAGAMPLALANAAWAVGDVAIGSLDWQPSVEPVEDQRSALALS